MTLCENRLPYSQLRCSVNGINIYHLLSRIGLPITVSLSYARVLGKMRSFQYRIFHRIIATNVLLMKMGIKDHDNCFFCDSKPETIEHLFWYCDRISHLWIALANWIWSVTDIEMKFSLESVLLG